MFYERRQNGVPRSIDSSTWTSLGNLSGAQWTAGGRTTCVVSIVSVDLLKKLCGREAAWGPHHCTKTQQQWTWQRGTWTGTTNTAKKRVAWTQRDPSNKSMRLTNNTATIRRCIWTAAAAMQTDLERLGYRHRWGPLSWIRTVHKDYSDSVYYRWRGRRY